MPWVRFPLVTPPDVLTELGRYYGEMAEWLIASVLKTELLERVTGVRTPLSPPSKENRESADGNNYRTSIRHTLLKTPRLTEVLVRYGV